MKLSANRALAYCSMSARAACKLVAGEPKTPDWLNPMLNSRVRTSHSHALGNRRHARRVQKLIVVRQKSALSAVDWCNAGNALRVITNPEITKNKSTPHQSWRSRPLGSKGVVSQGKRFSFMW